MKMKILCELKASLLLFLWLLLIQFTAAFFTVLAMLALALGGIIPLVGPTPLWQWIVGGVLTCLFWMMMGWFAPHVVQPRPAGAVIVLTIWAALTFLMANMPLLFLAQELGGMLGQILRPLGHSSWIVEKLVPCLLLPAALGMGLFLGRKRTVAVGYGGESE